jgi:hypothetical protein
VTSIFDSHLSVDFSFTFSTKTLELSEFIPLPYKNGHTDLSPIIFIAFNQRIISISSSSSSTSTDNILNHLQLRAETGEVKKYELVDVNDVATTFKDNKELEYYITNDSYKDKIVVIRPSVPLTPNTSYNVVLLSHSNFGEGPLPTTNEQSRTFSTYPKLAITEWSPQEDNRRW